MSSATRYVRADAFVGSMSDDRVAKVFARLVEQAQKGGLVTYQQLADLVGLPPVGNYMGAVLGEILGTINDAEIMVGRPLLSSIVVNSRGELPEGFYRYAEYAELLDPATSLVGKRAFAAVQRAKVYERWMTRR